MIDLWPFQADAVQRTRESIKRCCRTLLVSPTGSGKTVIASHIVSSAVSKGNRVLFCAHRRELIDQTVDKLLDRKSVV